MKEYELTEYVCHFFRIESIMSITNDMRLDLCIDSMLYCHIFHSSHATVIWNVAFLDDALVFRICLLALFKLFADIARTIKVITSCAIDEAYNNRLKAQLTERPSQQNISFQMR